MSAHRHHPQGLPAWCAVAKVQTIFEINAPCVYEKETKRNPNNKKMWAFGK